MSQRWVLLQWMLCLWLLGLQPTWGLNRTSGFGYGSWPTISIIEQSTSKTATLTTNGAEGNYHPYWTKSTSGPRIVYSQPAAFTEGVPPSISVQPVSRTACSANGIQFSVQADGTDLRYAWQFYDPDKGTWVTLSPFPFQTVFRGIDTNTVTVFDDTPSTEQYQVQIRAVVSNDYGSVTSQPATLTKPASALITQQPADQIACSSKGLDYRVQVKQEANLSYDWEYKDSNGRDWASLSANASAYPGYNTAVLITNGDEPNGRQYRVKVNNGYCPIYSDSVTFTKLRAAVITQQPISQTACSGKGLKYSVQADGDDLAYDWEFKDPDMTEWKSLSAFADSYPDYYTATLTANGVETPGRQYRVLIFNECDSVYSQPAIFTLPTQVITQQPISQTACSVRNNGLQYSVQANGSGSPLTYDWEFKDPDMTEWKSLSAFADSYPGYNTATLTTNGVETPGRQYRVKITNRCGTTLYSQSATFTLATTTPVITQQPTSQSACTIRQNGLLYTVVVESTGQVNYDWEFKDPDMTEWKSLSEFADSYPGYNTATLTTNGVETPGRQYRVKINKGCAYSEPATFTLVPTPSIIAQPASQTACTGIGLKYEVKVDGSGSPLTYDWEFKDSDGKDWVSLSDNPSKYPGYNTATLTTDGIEQNGRQYRVKITNGGCTVYSEPATYTRLPGPSIIAQPASQSACSSKGLQYEVKIDGNPLGYLWEYNDGQGWIALGFNDGLYPGYNSPILTTTGDEPTGRQYRLLIAYSCGQEHSQPATFTLVPTPSIIAQPASQSACSGKGLQYTVQAEGDQLTYDWEYKDGGDWASLSFDSGVYPGYNSTTLTTNGDEPTGRQYRVKVMNGSCTVYSEPATYTQIQCAPTLTNFSAAPKSVAMGQSIDFTATVGGVTGPYNYTLTNGAGSTQTGTASGPSFSQRLTAQGTGIQTYTLTIGNSLYAVTGTVSVTVASFAITGLSARANPVKSGQSVEFTATLTGLVDADIYSYTLTNGQEETPLTGDYHGPDYRESVTAQGSGPQTYTLTVTSQKGTATAAVSVTVIGEDVGSERFAISGVRAESCETLSENQRQVRFTPQYVGINGEPISFSVVNELAPTIQPGPYTLHLYTDNPTITLVAQQGSRNEVRFVYKWLAACTTGGVQAQPPTTSGIPSQTLGVGQSYQLGLTDYITDPDGQMPQFAAQGLPPELSLLESVISGTPSVTGTYPVSVTATDPGGLSIIVTFQLTITPAMSTSPDFSIGGVNLVSCALVDSVKQGYQVRFIPQYGGLNGQPVSFSVVNEMALTTSAGPYTLRLYADNPFIILKATQQGSRQEASFSYNWLAACRAQAPVTPGSFALVGVTPVSCEGGSGGQHLVRFTPQYTGLDGSPVSFSVVNELAPTIQPGPYTLHLYTDNPTITLVAQQGNHQAQYTYNWLDDCPITSSGARKALADEISTGVQVKLLGNPITNHEIRVEVKGVEGQPVDLTLTDLNGRHLSSERIEQSAKVEQLNLRTSPAWGNVFLLRVRVASPTGIYQQTLKVIQEH